MRKSKTPTQLLVRLLFISTILLSINLNGQQEWKITALDGNAGDRFANQVDIFGDYAILGAFHDGDNGVESGSAYIFKFDGTNWDEKAKLIPSDVSEGSKFGRSVALYQEYAVVGAHRESSVAYRAGAVYVFKREGENWIEKQKLTAEDAAANEQFGTSVSIFENFLIIGCPNDDIDGNNDQGSVYLFERNGETWEQMFKLIAEDGDEDEKLGMYVSLYNDMAAVGCKWDDAVGENSGSVYVFKKSGSFWNQDAKITPSDASAEDFFGDRVKLFENLLVASATGDDDMGPESGSAYIFEYNGSFWSQKAKLFASDGAEGDEFGRGITLNAEIVLISSPSEDENGLNSGASYLFSYNGSTWTEINKIMASDGDDDDHFGASAELYGEYAIMSSSFDDDNGLESGSAYIYKIDITGLLELNIQNSLSVYPNPFDKMLTIQIPNANVNSTIIIQNSLGKIIFKENVRNSSHYELNTSEFSHGIYLLSVINETGSFVTKIVKN